MTMMTFEDRVKAVLLFDFHHFDYVLLVYPDFIHGDQR